MHISKKYSKRSGNYFKLEFANSEEYYDVIDALKCAIWCRKEMGDGEANAEYEERVVANLERLRMTEDDGSISSAVFQEDLINLFCGLIGMANLIVDMNKYIKALEEYKVLQEENSELLEENNNLLKNVCKQHEENAELRDQNIAELKEVIRMLERNLNMHKLMIRMVHDEGFCLDEEGKKMWCTTIPEKDEDLIIFDDYFKFSQQTPPSDQISSIISEDED